MVTQPMKEKMLKRLEELQAEYQLGQEQVVLLEQRRQELRDTLLRIRGAMQILEEMLQVTASGDMNNLPVTAAQPSAIPVEDVVPVVQV